MLKKMIFKQGKYNDNNLNNLEQHIVNTFAEPDFSEGIHLNIGIGASTILKEICKFDFPIIHIAIVDDENKTSSLELSGVEEYSFHINNISNLIAFIEEMLGNRQLSSASITNVLDFLPEPEKLLTLLHEVVMSHSASLMISVPNITHKTVVFDLIKGDFNYPVSEYINSPRTSFYSNDRLELMMQNCGFVMKKNCDFAEKSSEHHFRSDSIFHSPVTTVNHYLSWLKITADPYGEIKQFVRIYSSTDKFLTKPHLNNSDNRPFLSIVTRTQGNRPLALQETLLCLCGQTNTNFEVIIVGHRLTPEGQSVVEQCIDDLPNWFGHCVRFVCVADGNRTKPLHVGFTEARGEYITVLDDDDLVFDNWVETFYNLSIKNSGTILHAYTVSQDWRRLSIHGMEVLRAIGTPEPLYCHDFDLLRQLYINGCPSMSYAIPSYVYHKLGIHFDLSLTTTEDWDFLMRSVFLCGISEARKTTSIYRRWENLDNATKLHSEDEWNKNTEFIIDQMDKLPIIIPPGYVKKIIDIHLKSQTSIVEHIPLVYYDNGTGLSENHIIQAESKIENPYHWYFTLIPDDWISSIRIDPGEKGMIILSNLIIKIKDCNDNIYMIESDAIDINGFKIKSGLFFIEPDPQIIVNFSSKMQLKEVLVSYNHTTPCLTDLLEVDIIHLIKDKKRFFDRLFSHIKRLIAALKRQGLVKTIKNYKKNI